MSLVQLVKVLHGLCDGTFISADYPVLSGFFDSCHIARVMKEQLSAWFENGCPWKEGVSIYSKIGTSSNLKRLFSRSYNESLHEKLKYELRKFHEGDATILIELKEDHRVERRAKTIPAYYDLPDELGKLRIKQHQLFAEAREYHSQLESARDDQSRAELAGNLMQCMTIVDEYWRIIDRYLETGALPKAEAEKEVKVEHPAEAKLRIKNLRTYVTKKTKRLDELSAKLKKAMSARERTQIQSKIDRSNALLQNHRAELAQLNRLIYER